MSAVDFEEIEHKPVQAHTRRIRKKILPERASLGEHLIVTADPLESGLWELRLSSRAAPARDRHVIAVAGEQTPVRSGVVVHLYTITTNLSIVHKIV